MAPLARARGLLKLAEQGSFPVKIIFFENTLYIRSLIGSADSSNILQMAGNGYFIADKFHLEDSLLN